MTLKTTENKNGETREQTEARLMRFYSGRQSLMFRQSDGQFPGSRIADLGPFPVRPASVNFQVPIGKTIECIVRLSGGKGRKRLVAEPVDRKLILARPIMVTVPVFFDKGTWYGVHPETGKRILVLGQDAGQNGNIWLMSCQENDTWLRGNLIRLESAATGLSIPMPFVDDEEEAPRDPVELVREMMGQPPRYRYQGRDGQTPVQILGVKNHFALENDLRAAYKKQMLKAHPENGGSAEDFQALNNAAAWMTLLKIMMGGKKVDIITVLGMTERLALVGEGETGVGESTQAAADDTDANLGPEERQIRTLYSYFMAEARNKGKRAQADQQLAVIPSEPATAADLGLDKWTRANLREAAVRLGLRNSRSGEIATLVPLVHDHLLANPADVTKVAKLRPGATPTTPTGPTNPPATPSVAQDQPAATEAVVNCPKCGMAYTMPLDGHPYWCSAEGGCGAHLNP